MVSTRAIAASHPVGGSARRGIARAGSSADPAGFPAIFAAATKTAGEPFVAAANDAPQPQSGRSNPLATRRERDGRQWKSEADAEAAERVIPGRGPQVRAERGPGIIPRLTDDGTDRMQPRTAAAKDSPEIAPDPGPGVSRG